MSEMSMSVGMGQSSKFRFALITCFTIALLLSAFLLFLIQPMFAKMVLPRLGGSPAVWSVAICFFQAMLLAGYAYAHGLIRFLGCRYGIIVHLALMCIAIISLPIAVAQGWDTPPESGQRLWVIQLLTLSVGLPFFVLSGNGPLLQAWFSRTGHKDAKDPYFLYGASNLGSLLALLSYPLLMEPALTIGSQSYLWSSGFILLIVFVLTSGLFVWDKQVAGEAQQVKPEEAIKWSERLRWVFYAMIPSALLVAVTSHLTTDIASAPFIWIVPLSLYLLTFIITFQKKPLLSHQTMLLVQPALIIMLLLSFIYPFSKLWLIFLCIHLLAFFVSAMVCHGKLVQARPQASQLTEFYLWMSFGGMLGGIMTSLIAPVIFSSLIEYPLLIALALLVRFDDSIESNEVLKQLLRIIAVSIIVAVIFLLIGQFSDILKSSQFYIVVSVYLLTAVFFLRRKAIWFAWSVAITFIICANIGPFALSKESFRGFFGVNYVTISSDGKHRTLTHGTTLHGAQRIGDKTERPEPLTYYHYTGTFADGFKAMRTGDSMKNVGIVGLGAGSLACYKREGETWRFFEIDPIVVKIAKDPSKFTFLQKCAPASEIIIGDARITLKREPDQKFDFLVIDAFSSDVVPVHLLTVQAVQEFMSKVSKSGVLLMHISNRNMDLVPVVSAIARDLGLSGRLGINKQKNRVTKEFRTGSKVVVLARSQEHLRSFENLPGWSALPATAKTAWTDDYSDVLGAIFAKLFD